MIFWDCPLEHILLVFLYQRPWSLKFEPEGGSTDGAKSVVWPARRVVGNCGFARRKPAVQDREMGKARPRSRDVFFHGGCRRVVFWGIKVPKFLQSLWSGIGSTRRTQGALQETLKVHY